MNSTAQPQPLFWPHQIGFWPRYFVHMRPYLLYVSGVVALVGMSMVPKPEVWKVVVASVPFFLSYGLGQALTDVFQTDTDAISSEYRPLVKGEIRGGAVLGVSLAGFGLACGIIVFLNPWVLPLGLLNVVGLILYTPFKRRWWGGPPWNSWIVALLPIMGFLSVGGSVQDAFEQRTHWWGLLVAVFFGYANFVVAGYFKDISADKVTNYNTIPVRFGWTVGALCSDFLAVACLGGTFFAIYPLLENGEGLAAALVLAIGAVVSLVSQIGLHSTRDENAVHGPIAGTVRSLIICSIAMIVANQPSWWLPMVPFYLAFEITLAVRPAQAQV